MRVIGREYRIDLREIRQRDHTARGVAIQHQAARRLHARGKRGFLESVPAPRRAWIVAADEGESLAALRHEMPRDRDARQVIIKSGNGVDRLGWKLPGLGDRDARAA